MEDRRVPRPARLAAVLTLGLALVAAPSTPRVGEEIGANDFLISDMGTSNGDVSFLADSVAVAYNSTDNEYLVVWSGEDDTGDLADLEREIYGQRIDAATGAELGTNDFRISSMGADGNISFDADDPAVAYNPTDNEYLVVWRGDDDQNGLVDNELEIFGQRLDAETGGPTGTDDFQISDMGGSNGDADFDATRPAVAYNATNGEYLVVWQADDTTDNEVEIWGQRLTASTGAETGTNDFRISDMGPDANDAYDAADPDVVYNGTVNEYLVVWHGDDDTGSLADGENEIYGQRLDAVNGSPAGTNDFRISDMGASDGDTGFIGNSPAVAHDSVQDRYLVVWTGEDDTGLLVAGEREIFGQLLDAGGLETGTNDFRISDAGMDGDANVDADAPDVGYTPALDEYLVIWRADDDAGSTVVDENEIYGQRIRAASGEEVGTSDFRLSDMGPDGDTAYDPRDPAVAFGSVPNEFLAVWDGEDNVGDLVDNEREIFGQRVSASLFDLFISGIRRGWRQWLGSLEPASGGAVSGASRLAGGR